MKKLNYYEGLIWTFITAVMLTIAIPATAQMNPCDSLEMSVDPNASFYWAATVESNIPQLVTNWSIPGTFTSVTYNWTSCLMCGTNVATDTSSMVTFFTDTTQMYSVCLTSTICINNLCYACTTCDTLVWNNGNWEMMSMMNNGNPTAIQEFEINTTNNNKMYDLLGRELSYIPTGIAYIQNRKIYIRK